MLEVTIKELQQALPLLKRAELHRAAAFVCGGIPLSEPVGLEVQLQLALWEWFVHLGFVDRAARRDLSVWLTGPLEKLALSLRLNHDGPDDVVLNKSGLPSFRLCIADQSYAHWSGLEKWYSLNDEKFVPELPAPSVTQIICDVTALYCRFHDRVVQLRKH
jgi:hypothetical protein